MSRPAGGRTVELCLEPVQQRQAIALCLVAEVVGQAGKAVDRHQVRPDVAGQQVGGDREVLVSCLGGEQGGRVEVTSNGAPRLS